MAEVESLIEAVHNAVLDPVKWKDFVQLLSSSSGGAPVLLALRAPTGRDPGEVYTAGIEERYRQAYCERKWSTDPLIADRMQPPTGAVLFRDVLLEASANREFNARWLAPQGLRPGPRISGVILTEGSGPSAYIHLFTRRRSRPLGEEDHSLVRTLMPHLRRAVLLCREHRKLRLERYAAVLGLEAQRAAVILVDRQGLVLFLSTEAGTVLDRAGLPVSSLVGQVMTALRRAHPHRAAWRTGAQGTLNVEVIARPVPPEPALGAAHQALVLIQLRDTAHAEPPDPDVLRQLYGLTRAEARLAALLAEGISPTEAAARWGLSLHTIRRQLKDIFSKTGVSRQGALVALLAGARGA